MPQEKTGLLESVQRWLEQVGYPLEMRAARVFRERGFQVQQSGYYQSPATGKMREIDIVAQLPNVALDHGPPELVLQVTVECKVQDRPWVAFVAPSADDDEVPNRVVTAFGGNRPARHLAGFLGYNSDMSALDLFKDVHGGYSVVQAFGAKGPRMNKSIEAGSEMDLGGSTGSPPP